MAVSAFCTPAKKAGRRSAGGASPRTPRSRASPRTPTSGGSTTPGTPGCGASARRHSGTPRNRAKALLVEKAWSSCPRGWAPVCVLRVGGKGSPLRRARTGSDTQPSASGKVKAPKKVVAMASYKCRTAPETRAIPLPRLRPRVASANRGSTSTRDHRMASENMGFPEVAVYDDQNSLVLNTPALDRRPIKFIAKGGKAYGHGKQKKVPKAAKAG